MKIEINGKGLLAIALLSSSLVVADFVTVANVKASGGVNVIGVDEEDIADAIAEALPVGTIQMWGGTTIPSGWVELAGQSTASYPSLAAVYGSTLPDFRGQFVRGKENGGSVLTEQTASVDASSLSFSGNAIPAHNHSRGTMEIYGQLSAPGYADSSVGYSLSGNGVFSPYGNKTTIDKIDGGANVGSIYRAVDFRASRNWTGSTSSSGGHTPSGTIVGGSETRPVNISVTFIVKAE